MAPLKLSNPFRRSADRPSLKERAAATAGRVGEFKPATSAPDPSCATAPPSSAEPTDWHAPPPGFMASPAIDPVNFAWIPQGLRIELDRLRDIAETEFRRRISSLCETGNDTPERAAALRASLFLPALTAAVDPGSVEAATLAALGRTTGPDPVLALIEEHRAAYAEWDRLSDVWSEMASDAPGYAEAMAASAGPGNREVAAYDALFAARPTTLSGVTALAEYLREATDRTRVDLVPSAADRGLATVTDTLRVILATHKERARRETSLVAMLDLASASLDDLQSLHDLADRVGNSAYALAWTGRCQARGSRGEFNVAGELMQWLGDALTDVETAANDEARRRRPTTRADRETRLEMLALPVIRNGDPDETAAFARELLAHVEAEPESR
ncbi:hypothetical protein MKK75_14860 [Methylobacterium sp. J-030]|uniref:hypothetical protein n=1 Tax=Methylobacterium sp. J-030 TaxID=2836627 RepID=UPI001FBBB016|nr:hypothetical protein [Methylobacterium sp. J-030]MCJ2070060.1 hypothetical protein [Methylobacterium sp. J-030]